MSRLFTIAAGIVALGAASASMAQTKAVAPLSFDDAAKIGLEAVKIAKTRGQSVSVVVVNREGRVIVALRMDGTSYLNLDVAQAKATTAAALGIASGELSKAIDGGRPSLLAVPGVMPIAGGVPVVRSGQTIAGVGVSGGAPDDDRQVAEAAAKAGS